jgi:GntR family transcriptional regulator/MocR family aminotransferase
VRVHPISRFYLPHAGSQTAARPAGLVMGYALLEPAQIDQGVQRLAAALDALG